MSTGPGACRSSSTTRRAYSPSRVTGARRCSTRSLALEAAALRAGAVQGCRGRLTPDRICIYVRLRPGEPVPGRTWSTTRVRARRPSGKRKIGARSGGGIARSAGPVRDLRCCNPAKRGFASRLVPMAQQFDFGGDYDHLARVVRMVDGRRRRRRAAMSDPDRTPGGRRSGHVDRAGRRCSSRLPRIPSAVRLGFGQCRLRQDARADAAGHPAPARRLRGPRPILCLTYTKAAASEMSNRVFAAALAEWAVLSGRGTAQDRITQASKALNAGFGSSSPKRDGCSPRRWKRRAG